MDKVCREFIYEFNKEFTKKTKIKLDLDNIKEKFKIIKTWYNFKLDPKLIGKNNIHITDVHGNLHFLLSFLVGCGVARFKNDEPPVVFFDTKKKKVYKTMGEAKNDDSYILNLRPIPNLEINPNFQGIATIGGDIFERGMQMEECFYTLLYLLQQQTLEKKLVLIAGNHELHYLINDEPKKRFNNIFKIKGKNEFKFMEETVENLSNNLEDAISSEKIVFCYFVANSEDSYIISHTVFPKNIVRIIPEKEENKELIGKIENSKPLNIIETQQLVEILNIEFRKPLNEKFFKEISELRYRKNGYEKIEGLKQVVGHEVITERKRPKFNENGVMYTDFGQSSLYKFYIFQIGFSNRIGCNVERTFCPKVKNPECKVFTPKVAIKFLDNPALKKEQPFDTYKPQLQLTCKTLPVDNKEKTPEKPENMVFRSTLQQSSKVKPRLSYQ